jgi:polyhydroxyalkanoate synthesis regulator phasin
MNDTILDWLQKGFRISLGAGTAFVETLQDPIEREQAWSRFQEDLRQLPELLQNDYRRGERLQQLQQELSHFSEIWAARGEMTEYEARRFLDALLAQVGQSGGSTTGQSTINTTATTLVSTPYHQEIQELTAQIAALRHDLETLKKQKDS